MKFIISSHAENVQSEPVKFVVHFYIPHFLSSSDRLIVPKIDYKGIECR